MKKIAGPAFEDKVRKLEPNQKDFFYVWEFLKSKGWTFKYPTAKDTRTYHVSGKAFLDDWKKLKPKKTVEDFGILKENSFIEKEDGIQMVTSDESTLRNDYLKYVDKYKITYFEE